jgi:hypothetical protein
MLVTRKIMLIRHGEKPSHDAPTNGIDEHGNMDPESIVQFRATERSERPQRALMVRLDRLGRGLGLEALAALSEIVQLGVTIHTRQDGDYTLNGAIENEARRDKAPSASMGFCRRNCIVNCPTCRCLKLA